MSDNDYLWDRSGADPEVERLETLLAPLAHDPARTPLDELRLQKRPNRIARVVGAIGAALAVAALIALVVWPRGACRSSGEGMKFTATGGEISCAGTRVARGVLPVGGTLDTGAHGAKLAIAKIGTAELGANTRIRLDRTDATGHNLHLERGFLHARVDAPPRLFAITTPSTAVTDLGCEYAIEVDASGAGSIRVLSGKVELQTQSGRLVVAPAGTHASILPGNRPGIPIATSASETLVDAVQDYERGVPGALERVLAAATETDAITLVNMAVLDPKAVAIIRRLGELAPSDNRRDLDAWRDEVVATQIAIDAFLDR